MLLCFSGEIQLINGAPTLYLRGALDDGEKVDARCGQNGRWRRGPHDDRYHERLEAHFVSDMNYTIVFYLSCILE